jgi:hypothetical protein
MSSAQRDSITSQSPNDKCACLQPPSMTREAAITCRIVVFTLSTNDIVGATRRTMPVPQRLTSKHPRNPRRDIVMISHAVEDNTSTRWLALQLARNGYRVWCDPNRRLGIPHLSDRPAPWEPHDRESSLDWPENLQWGYGRPPGISDTLEVPPPGTVEVTVTRRGRGNPGGQCSHGLRNLPQSRFPQW